LIDLVQNFHFLRPWFFIAWLPALALCFILLKKQKTNTQWHSLIDARLLPHLLDGHFSTAKKMPILMLLVLWLVAALAAAGPVWEKQPQPVEQEVSSMVILWDLSPSMNSRDIKPSRLVRSRLKLIDLLNARKEGNTALIAYAGDAHVVTPLTDDTNTIISLLSGLNPDLMPLRGSNPEQAMEQALALLSDTAIKKADIVFITDGIPESAFADLESQTKNMRHRVSVWGVGTEKGAPIPQANGSLMRNRQGEIVVAKVNDDELSEAAVSMGGIYIPFSQDKTDIETVLNFGLFQESKTSIESQKLFDQWKEQGHWLVLVLLPFAACAFRRGWMLGLVIAAGLLPSPPTYALSWQDLWQTADQQAQTQLNSGDAEAAAQQFSHQDWRGIANYRAGNLEQAQQIFDENPSADSQFNNGNTLTQQGLYDEAIEAYDAALRQNPSLASAKKNKAIAEKLKALEQQSQQNSDQNSQQGDSDDQQPSDQKGESGEQNDNDENAQEEQSSEGENADSEQDSQQNNEQDNDQTSESNDSSSDDEQTENAEQSDEDSLSEQEQQALEQEYGNADEPQPTPTPDTQENVEQMQAQPAEPEGNEESDQQASASLLETMSQEEKEREQSLQQWLRRVPDDPSGLLRNKFKYEHQKRQRESYSRSRKGPGEIQDERW